MIVAEQLTRKYGSRVAVDGVSFEVLDGEVVGFLGPNGAGKSTTLKMVAGYLPPTSGRVRVAGYDVVEDSLEARKHLGYMPETAPLYLEMRVEEYLAFRAEIKGVVRARKAAVARAMELAHVADVRRRIIGELSKGYRQRVGLADALVASPKLLILDEPTAGLDPNQIQQVRELIKSLGREHTIFISTHILPEVEAVCSRVVIIARGRIAAEGTPDQIRASMAAGARSASMVVRGTPGAIDGALGKVEGVKVVGTPTRLELLGGGLREAEELLRYTLEVDDAGGRAGERAEALVAACVSAGLGVRGLELSGKSLESIFHELTTTDSAASGGNGGAKSGREAAKSPEPASGSSKEDAAT